MQQKTQKLLVIGTRYGGLAKEDILPYITTTNRIKANKALAYCKTHYKDYEWRIRLI